MFKFICYYLPVLAFLNPILAILAVWLQQSFLLSYFQVASSTCLGFLYLQATALYILLIATFSFHYMLITHTHTHFSLIRSINTSFQNTTCSITTCLRHRLDWYNTKSIFRLFLTSHNSTIGICSTIIHHRSMMI